MEPTSNPYETPEGDLTRVDSDGVGEINFFSIRGRIGRLRYFSHAFLFYLAIVPGAIITALGFTTFGLVLLAIGYVVMVVLLFIAGVQRFHDLNRSAWWLLLFLVPLVNFIVALYVMLGKGTDGENDYGPRPPPNQTWNWILGMLMPVVAVVGIIAAVALPAYQDYTQRAADAQYQYDE